MGGRWIAGVLLGASLLVGGCDVGNPRAARAREARVLVERGEAVLVDVRTVEEFRAGHAPGAVNIPIQVLRQRMHELPKDRPVVVYCRSGSRSATAKRILDAAGFEQVIDIGPRPRWD